MSSRTDDLFALTAPEPPARCAALNRAGRCCTLTAGHAGRHVYPAQAGPSLAAFLLEPRQ
jgi:hypothetical protein